MGDSIHNLPEWAHLSSLRFCGVMLLVLAALAAIESTRLKNWVPIGIAITFGISLLAFG